MLKKLLDKMIGTPCHNALFCSAQRGTGMSMGDCVLIVIRKYVTLIHCEFDWQLIGRIGPWQNGIVSAG